MKRSPRFTSAVFAVALLGALLPGALQAATFEPLGVTCGMATGRGFCVVDMSGDGNTILYRDRIWRADSGFEMIGGPPGGYL
ncbi:MAG: hypothetical protein MUC67_06400, partial [Acidobacteria bacterium]|nr:hypothetical protein [Acidobacteriota bacterium]